MANQTELKATIKNLRIACSILIVILLIGAIVLSVGFGVYGKNTEDWFKKQEQQAEQLPDDGEQEGGQLIETIECQGVTLLSGLATTASDGSESKELSASVQPEGAEGAIDWSIAFVNPNSTWAQGKNLSDYVTYEMIGDTTRKISVTCKQAFGEQIIITATSIADSSKSASCTLDYEKRVTGFSVALSEKTAGAVDKINFTETKQEYTFADPVFTYGIGTITPTGETTCQYNFSSNFDYISTNTTFDWMTIQKGAWFEVPSFAEKHDCSEGLVLYGNYNAVGIANMANKTSGSASLGYGYVHFDTSLFEGSQATNYRISLATSVLSKVKQNIMNYEREVLDITCTFTSSNGNTFTGKQLVYRGTVDFPSLNVSSVSLNSSNLIF